MKQSDHSIFNTLLVYFSIAVLLVVGAFFLVNPHKSETSSSGNTVNNSNVSSPSNSEDEPYPANTESVTTETLGAQNSAAFSQSYSKGELFPDGIESISINYYRGYNIETGEKLPGLASREIVSVLGPDLQELADMLDKLEPMGMPEVDGFALISEYEIVVNGSQSLLISEGEGKVKGEEVYFEVPDELYGKVKTITGE